MDKTKESKLDLVAVLRTAERLGFSEGVDNHFSCLNPNSENTFLINPHRIHWAEVCVSDIVEIDFNGQVLGNSAPPEATAFFIHSRIHKRCPDAFCVLHTHMRYATALSMLENTRVEPAVQGALKFYGQIAYHDEFGGLALDGTEGDRLAEALGEKRILFLANHGVIIAGKSVAHAFNDLYYLEQVCRAQITALSSGKTLKMIPHDIAQNTFEQMQNDRDDQATYHFAAMKRILDRETPEYKK